MNYISTLSDELKIVEDYAQFAPKGEASLAEAVQMVAEAIRYCRENDIEGLLVDARELFGFPHPTTVDRYWFIREWANESSGRVIISFIQRPDMIDPEQIGMTIAANAGMIAHVSETEKEAREWLKENIGSKT